MRWEEELCKIDSLSVKIAAALLLAALLVIVHPRLSSYKSSSVLMHYFGSHWDAGKNIGFGFQVD
jgi:hypothetical protein